MKRFLLLAFVQLLALMVSAQEENRITYQLLQQSTDKSVSAYTQRWAYYNRENKQWDALNGWLRIIVVYDHGPNAHIDSVIIAEKEAPEIMLDSFSMDFIRLDDDSGTALTVYHVATTERGNLGEHGNYQKSQLVLELWDLMKHTREFSAIYKYNYTADFTTNSNDGDYSFSAIKYGYSYDIELTTYALVINRITRNLGIKDNEEEAFKPVDMDSLTPYPEYCECALPDHKAGRYKYQQGKYTWIE